VADPWPRDRLRVARRTVPRRGSPANNVVDLVHVLVAPDRSQYPAVANHAVGVPSQHVEQIELRARQRHYLAPDEHDALSQVDAHVPYRHFPTLLETCRLSFRGGAANSTSDLEASR